MMLGHNLMVKEMIGVNFTSNTATGAIRLKTTQKYLPHLARSLSTNIIDVAKYILAVAYRHEHLPGNPRYHHSCKPCGALVAEECSFNRMNLAQAPSR